MKFLKATLFVALIGLVVSLAWLSFQISLTVREVRPGLVYSANSLPTLEAQYSSLATNGNATLDTFRDASEKQATYWRNLPRITQKTIGDIHDLIVHTDIQLNGTPTDRKSALLPNATADLQMVNYSLGMVNKAAGDLDHSALMLPPILTNFDATSQNLVTLTADPKLEQSLDETLKILTQLEGTTTNANQMSALAFHEMQEYFKPATTSMRIFKFLAGHVVDGTEMWYDLFH